MPFVAAQRPASPNEASLLTSFNEGDPNEGGAGGGSEPGCDTVASNRVRTFLPSPKSAWGRVGVTGLAAAALLLLRAGVVGILAGNGLLLDLGVGGTSNRSAGPAA